MEALFERSPREAASGTLELLGLDMDGRDASAFMIVCRGIESVERAFRL